MTANKPFKFQLCKVIWTNFTEMVKNPWRTASLHFQESNTQHRMHEIKLYKSKLMGKIIHENQNEHAANIIVQIGMQPTYGRYSLTISVL